MNTKGKFYIRKNVAAQHSFYWDDLGNRWTSYAPAATFFDDRAMADEAAQRASMTTTAEVNVFQATKDIPE